MYPEREEKTAGPVYAVVERALWVLAPVVFLVLLLSVPSIRAAEQRVESDQAKDVVSENMHYCEKWGMLAGSAEYEDCIRDLVAIRGRTEQRLSDRLAGGF
jgi:hypothetical protein